MNLLSAFNVAIIGGADGPTAIYVSSPFPVSALLGIAVGAVLMAVAAVLLHRS